MHRDLKDFWHFSRKYQQFQRLSSLTLELLDRERELSEQGRAVLVQLDRERARCQERIAALNLPSIAKCNSCATGCCREPAEHYFTVIDFWLRKYTDHKVSTFSQAPFKPLHQYYRSRLAAALRPRSLDETDMADEAVGKRAPCAHLGATGCTLPYAERPLKCLIYACPELKRSLDEATRARYIEAVGELHRISLEAFNVLKVEAGFPPFYGLASIQLTL